MPKETRAKPAPLPSPALLAGGDDFGKELVNWLFPAYVTLIVVSVFIFLLKSSMTQGHEMSLERAVLTAVNAGTLTGFPQPVGPNQVQMQGQIFIVLLTVAGSLFSFMTGGLAVKRILRLPYTDRQVIRAALIGEIIALVIGACGACGTGGGLLVGASQGVAALGNSGVMLGKPFGVSAWQTQLIIVPMLFFGGIGITVVMEIWDLCVHGKGISRHATVAIFMSLGVYAVGVILFVLLQSMAVDFTMTGAKFAGAVASGSTAAINSRSGGIRFEDAYIYPRAMQWLLIVFMMIGASPGGTGGGIKGTTFYVLFGGTRRILRGENPGRSYAIGMSWVALYMAIGLAGLVLLLMAEPQMGADRVAFLAASALGNVGLSHDTLSNSPRGTYVLAALMLAGRMIPPLILWWMADTTGDAEVAVG